MSVENSDIGTEFMDLKRGKYEPDITVHTWNPSTPDTKAEGIELGQPRETLS